MRRLLFVGWLKWERILSTGLWPFFYLQPWLKLLSFSSKKTTTNKLSRLALLLLSSSRQYPPPSAGTLTWYWRAFSLPHHCYFVHVDYKEDFNEHGFSRLIHIHLHLDIGHLDPLVSPRSSDQDPGQNQPTRITASWTEKTRTMVPWINQEWWSVTVNYHCWFLLPATNLPAWCNYVLQFWLL